MFFLFFFGLNPVIPCSLNSMRNPKSDIRSRICSAKSPDFAASTSYIIGEVSTSPFCFYDGVNCKRQKI